MSQGRTFDDYFHAVEAARVAALEEEKGVPEGENGEIREEENKEITEEENEEITEGAQVGAMPPARPR